MVMKVRATMNKNMNGKWFIIGEPNLKGLVGVVGVFVSAVWPLLDGKIVKIWRISVREGGKIRVGTEARGPSPPPPSNLPSA